ncbi:multidrug effflux MFS transporter [Oceanobacter mangrovi]|uniref:multidrug effflux MFS transporter n=1 Tax=Oceanobacter mangrovi TaxID=2862510 RepID=UPI001C8D148D|nr:multidrug effflux MFS transporter [Oceanobacter mangrovi]
MSEVSERLTPALLLMLSALTALVPLATDIYLVAVPTIAEDYGRSLHDVELAVSFFLLGFAAGQVSGGPLSDRFGRRRMVLIGLSIFALGCLGIMLAPTLEYMLAFRVVQALGGGLAVVNSQAIIRDLASGREGAAAMIRVIQVMMIAPLVAPLLGLAILKLAEWHTIFGFLMVYALLLMLLFWKRLPETRAVATGGNPLKNYWTILSDRRVWGYLASVIGAYAAMLSFITASPGIYMGHYGLTENQYPITFACVVLTMVAMSKVNLKMLKKHMPPYLISLGQRLQMVVAAVMLAGILLFPNLPVWALTLMLMAYVGCHGFVVANANASIIEFYPRLAGTAAALSGALGFLSGGLAGGLVSVASDGTPVAMAAMMFGAVVVAYNVRRLVMPVTGQPAEA